jgi:uncharacterized protein YjbI with pentapeptide repeats
MKNSFFTFWLLCSFLIQAQIVNIPDANFKNALLNHTPTIDTNGDGEIQIREAESFTADMNLVDKNITDLTGIGSFINLSVLECGLNNLVSIDVSMFTALEYLDCRNNELTAMRLPDSIGYLWCIGNNLTSIDVSNKTNLYELNCIGNNLTEVNVTGCTGLSALMCDGNPNLTDIDLSSCCMYLNLLSLTHCNFTSIDVSKLPYLVELYLGENQLTEIDISNNPYLHALGLSYNNLTELDISNNPYLELFWCKHNQITSLDLSIHEILWNFRCSDNELVFLDLRTGFNTNIDSFGAQNNPDLTCIYVDDAEYSTENWTFIDENSTFVETEAACEELSIIDNPLQKQIYVYPNPIEDVLFIEGFDKSIKSHTANIYNLLGKLILEKEIINNKLNVSELNIGNYFISIESDTDMITKKIVKK